jgi:hypothetical protein
LADIKAHLGLRPPQLTINDMKQTMQEGLLYSTVVSILGVGLFVLLEHYVKLFNGDARSWSDSVKYFFKFLLPVALFMSGVFMVAWCHGILPRELRRRSNEAASGKKEGPEFLTQRGWSDNNPGKTG